MKNDENLLLNADINNGIILFNFSILEGKIELKHKISNEGEFAIIFYFKDETHYTSKIFDWGTKEISYQVPSEKVQFSRQIRIVNIDSDEVIFSTDINLSDDKSSTLTNKESLVQIDEALTCDKVKPTEEIISSTAIKLDTKESSSSLGTKPLVSTGEPLVNNEVIFNTETKKDNEELNNEELSQVEELISNEDITAIQEHNAPIKRARERMEEVESNPNSILSILSDDIFKLDLEEDAGLTVADIIKEISESVNNGEVVLRSDNVGLAKKNSKVNSDKNDGDNLVLNNNNDVKQGNLDEVRTNKKHNKFKVKPKDIIENLSIIQEILKEKKSSTKATDGEESEQENIEVSLTNDNKELNIIQSQNEELKQNNKAKNIRTNKLKRGLKMKGKQEDLTVKGKEDSPIIHIHSKKGGLLSIAPSEEITTYCSPKATPKAIPQIPKEETTHNAPSDELKKHSLSKNNKIEQYALAKEPTTDSLTDELSHRAKINSLLDEMFEIRE